MLNPQCCRLTPKFSPFPRNFNYCAIFLVVNSQKIAQESPLHDTSDTSLVASTTSSHPAAKSPSQAKTSTTCVSLSQGCPTTGRSPQQTMRPSQVTAQKAPSLLLRWWMSTKLSWELRILGLKNAGKDGDFGRGFTSPISWDVSNDHEDSAIKTVMSPMAMGILSSKLGLHHDWYNNHRDSTINRGRFKEPNKDVSIDMPMLFGWDLELVVGGFINTGTTRNTVKTPNPTRRWINLATVQFSYYLRLLEHGWHVAVRDSYYPSLGVPVFSTATLSTNLDSSPNAGSWFTSIYILGRTFGPDTRGVQGTVSPIFGQSSWQSPRFW